MTEHTDDNPASVVNSPELVEVLGKSDNPPNMASLEDFRALASGSQIQVERRTPTGIKGYCGNLVVPDGGMPDVLEEVKASWGGGSYQLRGKMMANNGQFQYCRGAIQVDIAGYPRDAGREYINGVWRPIAVPTPAAAPAMIQNPAGDGTSVNAMMGQLLQTALQGAMSGDGGVSMGELPALITAISGLSKGGKERDSFQDLDRTLGIVDKLRHSFGNEGGDGSSNDSPFGGSGSVMEMLMMKMMSDQNKPPPQQPPYQPQYGAYPNQNPQQMWGSMQQHGQSPHHPYPQNAPPPQQANWTNPPQPAQHMEAPARRPQPAAQPPPTQPPPQQPAPHPEAEYEPLTVDDIMQDLASRDETGRAQFMGELCEQLGLDQAVLATMFNQESEPVVGPPGPDVNGAPPVQQPAQFRFDQSFSRGADE